MPIFLQLKTHSACLFSDLQCSQPAFSSNSCAAYFTTKVKRPYLTFIYNTEHHLELFNPPPPSSQRFEWVESFRSQALYFQSITHHKRKLISSDDLLLCNCLNCQFNTDCILQYIMFRKKHSILQKNQKMKYRAARLMTFSIFWNELEFQQIGILTSHLFVSFAGKLA